MHRAHAPRNAVSSDAAQRVVPLAGCGPLQDAALLRRDCVGVRRDAERAGADQLADLIRERWHIEKELMPLERPQCARERKEHLAASQDLEHRVAPVIEERYRAGFFHHRPQPLYAVWRRLGENRDRTASCPVGPHAAWLE